MVLVDDVDDRDAVRDRVWRMHGYATAHSEDRELVAWTMYTAVGWGTMPAVSAAYIEARAEEIVTAIETGQLDRKILAAEQAELRAELGLPIGAGGRDDQEAAYAGRRRCLDIATRDRQRTTRSR